MRRPQFLTNKRGDTIVEVLIAMVVVSVVLAGSYAITTRNLSVTQTTDERSQAQQLVQKQIELLRVYSQKQPPQPAITSGCLTDDSAHTTKCAIPAGTTSAGQSSPNCSAYCYTLSITQQAGIPGVYQVGISWPSPSGRTATLSMNYGPPSS